MAPRGSPMPAITLYDHRCLPAARTRFASISVTGAACSLDCRHCGRVFLRHMEPAITPRALRAALRRIAAEGAVGCLVSGGCGPDGRVPIRQFLPAIAEAKRTTRLAINVHPGLADAEDARLLARARVDAVSLDVVGARETARAVLGLDRGLEDYISSYRACTDAGLPVVPHLTVGLHFGEVLGEPEALEALAGLGPRLLVLLVLLPAPGTAMAGVAPPSLGAVAEVFRLARRLLPSAELALGCMRPRGAAGRAIERLAVDMGFGRLAMPSRAGEEYARERGLEVARSDGCCALPAPALPF